ncbi:MAG: murein hydrolase activator EnvC family protein [Ruminococcus sp.]
MIKKTVSAVLAVILILGAVFVTNADTLSDLQAEQEALKQEAERYQAIIDEKQNDIDEQQAYVDAISEKVNNLNQQIMVSREKIDVLDSQIAEKEAEIDKLYANSEENMNTLRKRLRTLYMSGDASALEIILGASDFSDFVDKLQLVESINEYDAKLIDDIEAELDVINADVTALEADKAVLEEEQADLDAKFAELDTLLKENEEQLASLYTEREELDALLDSNESEQAENEQKIQAYYDSLNQDKDEDDKPSNSVTGGGSYVWPAPGQYWISSPYGEDRGYSHGGIDIAGSGFMGTTIVAAASGTVVDCYNSCSHNWGKYGSCGCNGGWGNYVWIDHGNGKATIYAHLSYHTTSIGARVSAGQIIGYGGTTGDSTGPHLHFETRYYGTRYNPAVEYPSIL